MYKLNQFSSRDELDNAFADTVAELLQSAITAKGSASIAVSGGNTPKGFFSQLSLKDIDWNKVTITLADERWVEQQSDASNTRLVKENLLQNKAAKALFFELKRDGELTETLLQAMSFEAQQSVLPFDVLILGMGEDGHTASLFPCSEQIDTVLADNCDALARTVPTTAPYNRITFSFNALAKSQNVFLHITGESKKQVLDKALADTNNNEMPIRAFLHHSSINTQIIWAN